jgi:hypothetical protein
MKIESVERKEYDYHCFKCKVLVTHYIFTDRQVAKPSGPGFYDRDTLAYYYPCGHSNYSADHGASIDEGLLTAAALMVED